VAFRAIPSLSSSAIDLRPVDKQEGEA